MLVLVNPNRLRPPIAPLGLEYVASAARTSGIETRVVDLNLAEGDIDASLAPIKTLMPRLVGISLRNVDDCFWPSAMSFIPQCTDLIRRIRTLTDAAIVVGGVGFSAFGVRLMAALAADFGLRGDGETAIVELYRRLDCPEEWSAVPGLIWPHAGGWVANSPAFFLPLTDVRDRDIIDNRRYFELGGQIGVETKRGCPRKCIYCADPVAKGRHVRRRDPRQVADECEALVAQGIDVLHLCDGEFNVPREHALAVCEALVLRGLGNRLRYYVYMATRPFDRELASTMRRSGCVGINFTGDSGSDSMLLNYRAAHRKAHLREAVQLCREAGITCMVDLLLGGPGETPETVQETIAWLKQIGPDCVGAGLGMRLYPDTIVASMLEREEGLLPGHGILRKYEGPIDLTLPTFYVSPLLGARPAKLVRDLIGNDPRFFPPTEELSIGEVGDDHNYSDNAELSDAIAAGARGAYWDILRRLRCGLSLV